MAIKLADTARPNNYVDAEHLGTYPVAYAEDVWFADGTRLSEKTFDGQSIQVDELPLASATEEGNVYQYIGISGTYQHGCFYECVEDSLAGAYVWKVLSIVKNGVIYTDEDLHDSRDYPIGSVIVYTGEPQWDFFKGHHYEFVEGETITTYGGNVVLPNGSHAVLNFKEKEIKVGNVIVDDNGSESYYTFNIVAVDGNTITLNNGSVYTDVEITDNVTTMDNFTGWIDIGGGGSEGNDYEEFIGTQAEWDALSQSQKNKYDGKIVNITDDTTDDEGGGEAYIDYYSTEETKTNKVWIDGKPIYRKVVMGLGVAINIDAGWVRIHSESTVSSLVDIKPYAGNGIWYGSVIYRIENGYLEGYSAGLNTTITGYILEYTKTTDG